MLSFPESLTVVSKDPDWSESEQYKNGTKCSEIL